MQVSGLYREISIVVMLNLSITYHSSSNNGNGTATPVVNFTDITTCVFPHLLGESGVVVAGRVSMPTINIGLLRQEFENTVQYSVSGIGLDQQVTNYITSFGALRYDVRNYLAFQRKC